MDERIEELKKETAKLIIEYKSFVEEFRRKLELLAESVIEVDRLSHIDSEGHKKKVGDDL